MKIKDILQRIETLNVIMSKEMNISAGYKIAKNIKLINDEVELFKENQKKLIGKYEVAVSEEGALSFINEDLKAKYIKDFEELQNIDTDLNFQKLSIENIDIKLTPRELLTLDFMLEEY